MAEEMQGMANRPPMGDSGEQMPMEDNQQANAQQQQITQIQNRVKSLPIQEKKVLQQSLTPQFKEVVQKVFGSGINPFIDVLESGIEMMPPDEPMARSNMTMATGEGMVNRPPEEEQNMAMAQRPTMA
jgi:hypothetical protein